MDDEDEADLSEAEKARADLQPPRQSSPPRRRDPSGPARAAAVILSALEHLDDDGDRIAVLALSAALVDGAMSRLLPGGPAGVPSPREDDEDD